MSKSPAYQSQQQDAFGKLVEKGVYSDNFGHSAQAQRFFGDVMEQVLAWLEGAGDLQVLDCGCGPGAWLDYLSRMEVKNPPTDLFGFDLTEQMIPVARRRLKHCALHAHLHTGDILDEQAYRFPNNPGKYNLIMAYDVVQQIPRALQFRVCEMMLRHLTPHGIAVIFDNDCHSPFGRKMALRKFITRYLRVALVPRYFCNAKYPPLQKFADKIARTSGFSTEIKVSPNAMKRALIIRATG